jgi:hypothetical protein
LAEDVNMDDRPYILLTVNSIDSWGRDRIEGYGFARMPHEAGYHNDIQVETWRPRGSLNNEIHQFFLGGSIRIPRLEEIVKTRILDDEGKDDIVNRFGLETENAGTIRLNLNMAYQNRKDRKENREAAVLIKGK